MDSLGFGHCQVNLGRFLNMGEEEIASVVAELGENLSSGGKYSATAACPFFFFLTHFKWAILAAKGRSLCSQRNCNVKAKKKKKETKS